jgi:hypothetical protein
MPGKVVELRRTIQGIMPKKVADLRRTVDVLVGEPWSRAKRRADLRTRTRPGIGDQAKPVRKSS